MFRNTPTDDEPTASRRSVLKQTASAVGLGILGSQIAGSEPRADTHSMATHDEHADSDAFEARLGDGNDARKAEFDDHWETDADLDGATFGATLLNCAYG